MIRHSHNSHNNHTLGQTLSVVSLVCFALVISQTARAETLPVNVGKWQRTTTISSPDLPQPRINAKTECIDEPEVDPFTPFTQDGCEVSNVKKTGGKLTGSLTCKGGEGVAPMNGTMEYTITETTMNSRMQFKSEQYSQTIRTVGRRLGECDPAPAEAPAKAPKAKE